MKKYRKKLKICFIGGKQAGIVGALAILSNGNKILSAVSYSEDLAKILNIFKIPLYKSINDKRFITSLRKADILLSVHGREIIRENILKFPKYGAVNLHPYLYKYKGANPVERALKDREFKASVGAHVMEGRVDEGEVLFEEFINVAGSSSAEEVYNKLYPSYVKVILKVLGGYL